MRHKDMIIGKWIQEALEDSEKKNAIATLDGVRAIACLLVIWFHIDLITHDTHVWNAQPFGSLGQRILNSFLFFGSYGVTLFFVLSGFLLFMPFARALLFEKTWPSERQFYLRRVFRIVPAYYLSLILIVLFYQQKYLQPQHWLELGLFFTFLMDSTKATFVQLNGPFWTLAVEWQYYMLLPVLVLCMRSFVWRVKLTHRLTATIACILALIGWGLFSRYWGEYFIDQHPLETFLVSRPVLDAILFFIFGQGGKYLEDFGVGMLLSLCYIYVYHRSVSPTMRQTLRKLSPVFLGIGLFFLFTMILWSFNQRYFNAWPVFNNPILFNNYAWLDQLGFALSFGLCIFALLFGYDGLKRPLEWLPLRRIGTISFSLYMWHLPLLFLFMVKIAPLLSSWPSLLIYSTYWLWALVVIIPFSFLFYLYIEKPGIRFGERFQRKKRNLAPSNFEPATPVTESKAGKVEEKRTAVLLD